MSEDALQIAVKRREAKDKGEKEKCTHVNAEFQRIARRDKKDFLSDQCKEIEENNRMGKTRDLFKKIKDIKGTFHAKMDTVKDRNCMDPTEAEDIKSRWQTQILNDTIDQLDLIDIYRTFHLKTINFTFFSSAHGTFSRVDHILGHKSRLGKLKKKK